MKFRGFIQTYDWTTHSGATSISKLREIGQQEKEAVPVIYVGTAFGSNIDDGYINQKTIVSFVVMRSKMTGKATAFHSFYSAN